MTDQKDQAVYTGRVKWFNNIKGFGFIVQEGRDEDLFAHYSAIQSEGYRTLRAGQEVSFSVVEVEKRFHAKNIQVLETGLAAAAETVSPETECN